MYKINRILDEDLEDNEQDNQVIHNVDLLLSQRPPKLSVSTIVLSDDEERSENAVTKNYSRNSLNVTLNIDLDYVQTQALHEGTSIVQDKANRRSDRLRRLSLVREKEKLKHVESNQETITNKDNCAEKNSGQAKTKKWRLSLEPNDLNESIIRKNIQVNELSLQGFLAIDAPDVINYARKISTVLFSKKEFMEFYIKLGSNKAKNSKRKPFNDQRRLKLLMDAIRIKFDICDDRFPKIFKNCAVQINRMGNYIKKQMKSDS